MNASELQAQRVLARRERERGFGLTLNRMQMCFVLGHHRSGSPGSESTRVVMAAAGFHARRQV